MKRTLLFVLALIASAPVALEAQLPDWITELGEAEARGGGRLAPPPPTCSGAGHLSGPGSGERLVAGRDTDLLRSRRCRPPVPGSAAAS
jgi:hypothetical protein